MLAFEKRWLGRIFDAVLPADVRFVDGDDAGEAALYGADQFDAGDEPLGGLEVLLEEGDAVGGNFELGAVEVVGELLRGDTKAFRESGVVEGHIC